MTRLQRIRQLSAMALGLVDDIVSPLDTITHITGYRYPVRTGHKREIDYDLDICTVSIHYDDGCAQGCDVLAEDALIIRTLAKRLGIVQRISVEP
jgi:hypothetical protein